MLKITQYKCFNVTTFKLRSYIRDTTHFLQKISTINDLPVNTLLVTLDVESLYTNIPHTYGLQAAKDTLNATRTFKNVQPSNNTLIKLLEMVLTKINFQFNGQDYWQAAGTAMGTKVAVGYANNTLLGNIET